MMTDVLTYRRAYQGLTRNAFDTPPRGETVFNTEFNASCACGETSSP